MSPAAPGKHSRDGLSLVEVMDLFPTEDAAAKWFEGIVWAGGRCCGKCGSLNTREANHKTMPYWCTDCRSYFSVRTGTPLAKSNVPLRKWAIAIYLCLTSMKSVSSIELHRDLKVTQSTAWFILHRIREAWMPNLGGGGEGAPCDGPTEVDEECMGGKRKNRSRAKQATLEGRGAVGKTAIVGMKGRTARQVRAKVVESADMPALQGFVVGNTAAHATAYSDEASACTGLPMDHGTIGHSVSEYVRGQAHANGIESFRAMPARAHEGTFHKMSPKHPNRCVQEFAGKKSFRESDTLERMNAAVPGLMGRALPCRRLVRDDGLSSGARS